MPTVFPAYELTRLRSPDEQLRDRHNVKDYGAVGDGVQDDTVAIQATFAAAIAAGGGVVEFPYGTYLVSATLGNGDDTHRIVVEGGCATIRRAPTTVQYGSMFSPGSNWSVRDLWLEGYVESGTTWADVVPAWSFGFRVSGSQSNVEFRNCHVDNIPYDGWYISGTTDVRLVNCTGGRTSECYRNTVAIAPSGGAAIVGSVAIIGGSFAKAKGRPAIDVEPDNGGVVKSVWIGGGCRCTGPVDVIVDTVQDVCISGLVMDGADAVLRSYFCSNLDLANVAFINGATLGDVGPYLSVIGTGAASNVQNGKVRLGVISGIAAKRNAENLLTASYDTVNGWSLGTSGGGSATVTPHVAAGRKRGVRVNATSRANTYSQVVPASPSTYYSVGAYCKRSVGTFGTIVVYERNGSSTETNVRTFRGGEDGYTNGIFKTRADTAEIRVVWGSHSSGTDNDVVVSELYVREGLADSWEPNAAEVDAPLYDAAPAAGTWAVGERSRKRVPAVGQPKGWTCTAAGTPGTHTSEGNL